VTLHMGPKHKSKLLVPVIPKKKQFFNNRRRDAV